MHIGSGASICAIRNGTSIDTSMGLTPASGLPGATRAGDIDPTLIFHYTHQASKITHDKKGSVEVDVTHAEELLNTQAGWKSLVGSSDFRDVTGKMENEGEEGESAKLAFELVVDRVINYVGAYYLKLGGEVDALVFAGGIGEKSVELRSEVVKRSGCLGFVVDDERNQGASKADGEVVEITGGGGERDNDKGRAKRVLVCRTDEQVRSSCYL